MLAGELETRNVRLVEEHGGRQGRTGKRAGGAVLAEGHEGGQQQDKRSSGRRVGRIPGERGDGDGRGRRARLRGPTTVAEALELGAASA